MTPILLLLLAFLPQTTEGTRIEQALAAAEEAVRALTADDAAPAIGLALRCGDAVRATAWGWADVAEETAATPDTRFRLASVSKCLTGSLAALLWEDGTLDLDAPIQTYLPDFPSPATGAITSRLLGGHLAGIPHYGRADRFEPGEYHSVRDGLRVFAHRPLAHAPGTKFLYSSYGFNLLGATLEAAAETEFRELMRARIFAPLGMNGIVAEHPEADLGSAAKLYERVLGATIEVPRDDIAYKWPGGGFVATPRDLVRFARAFDANGPVLSDKTRALMRTAQRAADGKDTGYSLGLRVGAEGEDLTLSHSGAQTGAKTYFLIHPDQRIAVAVFANHSGSSVADGKAARRAAELLLEALAPQSANGSPTSE